MELWVIVSGLALLMVLGSILWIMPSKRDRRIAKLRQAAILKGFKVKIMQYPMKNDSGRVEEAKLDGAAYFFPNALEGLHAGWMLIRSDQVEADAPEGWSWYIKQGALSGEASQHINELLERYSSQLLAISIMSGWITIGWNEQGQPEDLIEFDQWTKTMKSHVLTQLTQDDHN